MPAQELAGAVKDLKVVLVQAHRDDVARRGRYGGIVRAQDLHQAAVIDGVRGFAEVAEAHRRQRLERRLLLSEHREHLAFLAAVDARRRPALLPVREPRILLLDRVELAALERGGLGVLDGILHRTLGVKRALHMVTSTARKFSPSHIRSIRCEGRRSICSRWVTTGAETASPMRAPRDGCAHCPSSGLMFWSLSS